MPERVPTDPEVIAFLAALDHPHADAARALCTVILNADPAIADGIKWKVPSFRTREYFATLNLRAKIGVGVILHFGAKTRADVPSRDMIADPSQLLQWLAADRAQVLFSDAAAVRAHAPAFTAILHQWITHV